MVSPARALWLLVVVALAITVPLFAADTCDDSCGPDSCGAHCGDCASCPLVAELYGAPDRLGLIATTVLPGAAALSRSDHPRALDHVPLRRP
jgi:hypothetical protein